jgi:hypothetical protein
VCDAEKKECQTYWNYRISMHYEVLVSSLSRCLHKGCNGIDAAMHLHDARNVQFQPLDVSQ